MTAAACPLYVHLALRSTSRTVPHPYDLSRSARDLVEQVCDSLDARGETDERLIMALDYLRTLTENLR